MHAGTPSLVGVGIAAQMIEKHPVLVPADRRVAPGEEADRPTRLRFERGVIARQQVPDLISIPMTGRRICPLFLPLPYGRHDLREGRP